MSYIGALVSDYLRLWFFLPTQHLRGAQGLGGRVVPMTLFVLANATYLNTLHGRYPTLLLTLGAVAETALYAFLPSSIGVRCAMIATVACLLSLIPSSVVSLPVTAWQWTAITIMAARGFSKGNTK